MEGEKKKFPPKPKEQTKKNPNRNIKPDAEGKTQKGVRAMKVQHAKQKDVLVKDVKSQTNRKRPSRHSIEPEKIWRTKKKKLRPLPEKKKPDRS